MSRMNSFPCPVQSQESAGLLLEYLDRRLAPELAAQVERHVAVCAECQRVTAAQNAVWDALDQWEPTPVSPDFNERLFARIDAERERPAGFWAGLRASAARMFDAVSVRPAIPAAAACAVVAGVFLLRPPAEPVLPAEPSAQVETIDVEQVEKTLADVDVLHQLEGSLADEASPSRAL